MQAFDNEVHSLQAVLVTHESRAEVAEAALASQDKVMHSPATITPIAMPLLPSLISLAVQPGMVLHACSAMDIAVLRLIFTALSTSM